MMQVHDYHILYKSIFLSRMWMYDNTYKVLVFQLLVPLSVCLRAAGVLRRIVGGRRDGWNKLLKVHDVGKEGVLRSGAFWVDGARAMWCQLGGERRRHIKIIRHRWK